jgi:CRP/FNR family transcriptional regulator
MKNGTDVAEEISRFCQTITFATDQTIYAPGQRSPGAYLIKQGKVKLAYLDESGKKLTLAILGEGDIFGEMALVSQAPHELSTEALEDCTLWLLERKVLLQHAHNHPKLMVRLMQLFLRRAQEMQTRLKEMVFKDLETRLARTLLNFAYKYGLPTHNGLQIDLQITHQELAELIGSTRENVTTALTHFEDDGLLDKRRFHIVITDIEGLEERATPRSSDAEVSKN